MSARDALLAGWADGTPRQQAALAADLQAVVDEALKEQALQYEADLERVRDQAHRLGVQAVVDRIRGRLDITSGVPSRASLQAMLGNLERSSGVQRG